MRPLVRPWMSAKKFRAILPLTVETSQPGATSRTDTPTLTSLQLCLSSSLWTVTAGSFFFLLFHPNCWSEKMFYNVSLNKLKTTREICKSNQKNGASKCRNWGKTFSFASRFSWWVMIGGRNEKKDQPSAVLLQEHRLINVRCLKIKQFLWIIQDTSSLCPPK